MDDAVAALRALRYGELDDATSGIALPPTVRASLSPAISAMRWGALVYGLVLSAPEAFEGSYSKIVTLAVAVFLTTWRTIIPVRLASNRTLDRFTSFSDVVVLGVAVGIGGALQSPFIFSLMISVVVVGFGWGYVSGISALLVGLISMSVGALVERGSIGFSFQNRSDLTICLTILLAVVTASAVRSRFSDAESRRLALAGQVEALSEANGLLTLVNSVARTLPTSLTLREALHTAQRQISDTFDARVVCLVTLDENAEEWVPKLAEGTVMRPAYRTSELPDPLAAALRSDEPVLRGDISDLAESNRLNPASKSGIYVRLDARDTTIGLLGLEHPTLDHFADRDVRVLAGLAEVLALTIDNARWFGRLRSLGAEEERIRLARDLHDRLGQWLTYIGFELERINSTGDPRPEDLDRLHSDVRAALDELRETLRQLRSGVSETEPLSVVAKEVVDRFSERAGVASSYLAADPENRLPVPIENELLRILQESLNNVQKHASADNVAVLWAIEGGNFELCIQDDGRGFDTSRGVRDSAYGLVGMRERADVIGAHLEVISEPGAGTTIRVVAGVSPVRPNDRPSVPIGGT